MSNRVTKESMLTLRLEDSEREEILKHATNRGKTASDHIREILLKAARGEIKLNEPKQLTLL